MSTPRQILVTTALPYANGPLHLGHMVEYIQADIWVRFQRLSGHTCHYICGDDAHGTPVMIRAQQEGLSPEEWTKKIYDLHRQDFEDFNIALSEFYTTHSPENKTYAELFYQRLKKNGDFIKKTISQAFDAEKNMFLPDRYVKGECPKCSASDQYGDSCEQCGANYSSLELKNPRSVMSGTVPISKESEHLFFQLAKYADALQNWFQQSALQEQVVNKLQEWFEAGLQDWDISRDAPYFGFEIPDMPGKFFYVWLDAPIGYMSAFQHYCDKNPELNFAEYWDQNSSAELYHFIGKDVMYFHTLFWPALLKGAGFRLPTSVYTHGFLTVNGAKMSKSRGTFITARQYLDRLPPDCLRYYFAGKLSSSLVDLDLNFADFKNKVNSDLVGKIVNIASRAAGFIHKNNANLLAEALHNPALYDDFIAEGPKIAAAMEERDFAKAVRFIMQLADRANQYIDEQKPWTLNKDPDQHSLVQQICTSALNLFKVLILYLKPIVPTIAAGSEKFLNIPELTWLNYQPALLSHQINPFVPLLQRVTDEEIAFL